MFLYSSLPKKGAYEVQTVVERCAAQLQFQLCAPGASTEASGLLAHVFGSARARPATRLGSAAWASPSGPWRRNGCPVGGPTSPGCRPERCPRGSAPLPRPQAAPMPFLPPRPTARARYIIKRCCCASAMAQRHGCMNGCIHGLQPAMPTRQHSRACASHARQTAFKDTPNN
jgi:hypothetical protein